MPRLTTRYAKDMVAGDGVLIWKSGDKAGIYAIAEIIEPPKSIVNAPDIGYWKIFMYITILYLPIV
jgi:hypothetical protein